jgi:hypothetical protein
MIVILVGIFAASLGMCICTLWACGEVKRLRARLNTQTETINELTREHEQLEQALADHQTELHNLNPGWVPAKQPCPECAPIGSRVDKQYIKSPGFETPESFIR